MGKKKGKKKTKAKPILTTGGDEIINSFDVDDGHPQSVPPQPTDDVWLVMMEEEVKSMKTSQIKTDLESRGISTRTILERDELINALVCAIKEEMSTRQSQQRPQCDDNECSHGSNIDSMKKIPFFLVAFEENLGEFAHKIVINHGLRAVCVSNPTRFWVDIMEGGMLNPRYPSNCHPDYKDRDVCEKIVECLVVNGTDFLLKAEESHREKLESHRETNVILAGFIAHTAMFVEECSKRKSGDVNMHSFSTKGGDLWHIKEHETIEFFHKRNGCTCLKEMYDRLMDQTELGDCKQPIASQQQQQQQQQQGTMIGQLGNLTLRNMGKISPHGDKLLIPEGAMCFICLGDGEDDEGGPLVRDCSCRGDNAGFAHLSCIIQYAEQKSKQAKERDLNEFKEPWERCTGCKQLYRNQLSLDLSSACFSFAKATYGGNNESDKLKVMTALKMFINATICTTVSRDKDITDESNRKTKMEVEPLIGKLLSMVDEMKEEKKMDNWVSMPPSTLEYQFYKFLCGGYEALGYKYAAEVASMDTDDTGLKASISYYEKARVIFSQLGIRVEAEKMDAIIVIYRSRLANNVTVPATQSPAVFDLAKSLYEGSVERSGSVSPQSISGGLTYGRILIREGKSIEGERLLMKLLADSSRIHGPEHVSTKEAIDALNGIKTRYVLILNDDKAMPGEEHFQALRYDDDGKCVVTGPITEPRRKDEESEHRVPSNLVLPFPGCPVMCHGLVSAPHLNGQFGGVKCFLNFPDGVQVAILLENMSLATATFSGDSRLCRVKTDGTTALRVKPENLRILFDLPIAGPSNIVPGVESVLKGPAEDNELNEQMLSYLAKSKRVDAKLPEDLRMKFKDANHHYASMIEAYGATSAQVLAAGLTYSEYLVRVQRKIEGERLVRKLVTISRRVHGPKHHITCKSEAMQIAFKMRYGWVVGKTDIFQILRYETDDQMCVVKGPVTKPEQDQITFHVACDLILPADGSPVICCGLVSATHLNGEMAEVKEQMYGNNGIQLKVHFFGSKIQGKRTWGVKPVNLRVAFELPEEE